MATEHLLQVNSKEISDHITHHPVLFFAAILKMDCNPLTKDVTETNARKCKEVTLYAHFGCPNVSSIRSSSDVTSLFTKEFSILENHWHITHVYGQMWIIASAHRSFVELVPPTAKLSWLFNYTCEFAAMKCFCTQKAWSGSTNQVMQTLTSRLS